MKIFIPISILCIYMLSGCSNDIKFNSYNPQKDYGFVVSSDNGSISNPPPTKTRIYAFRKNTFIGGGVRYNITIHSLAQAQQGFNQGFFFGYSRPGGAFMMDIVPNGEPIVVSGKTEARAKLAWIPQAGKIYCLASGVGAGIIIGRPAFTLVDKEICQKYITKYLTQDSMRQWLADKQDYEKKNHR